MQQIISPQIISPRATCKRIYELHSSSQEKMQMLIKKALRLRMIVFYETTGVPSSRYECVMWINFLKMESVSRYKQPLRPEVCER